MTSLKILFFSLCTFTLFSVGSAQSSRHPITPVRPFISAYDTAYASRLPVLELPSRYRNNILPSSVDNTLQQCWPGISDQHNYYTCQQFSGVTYVFGYEINRKRNIPGWYWENRYPPHYTWNFLNHGEQYEGVSFFQSFDFIRQQGHMTQPGFGVDTAHGTLGWINGYSHYLNGMTNRLKNVCAIRVNSEEGILTLKNYLYDHLDGSTTGGIACFTTSGQTFYYSMFTIPEGTPEAGKDIVTSWIADPTHALTIVGYNDSIRYDVNKDGQYTNNIDINGDGIVNVLDWEIGAFKFANSYGGWWSYQGVAYVLYRAMASNYGDGGIWNNSVFVVEPDDSYHPLLTAKVNLEFNQRDKIRILAGISSDTTHLIPDFTMDFPLFNFQGGNHPMQGYDSISGSDTLEFGLDITPLLSLVNPGKPVRIFFIVEERDQNGNAHGKIKHVEFIFYGNIPESFSPLAQDVAIRRNDLTMVSAVSDMIFPKVQITTSQLQPLIQGQPYSVQMHAAGGFGNYRWSISQPYERSAVIDSLPVTKGQKLVPISYLKPYAVVKLPFSFPFYGEPTDSLYVNFLGFVSPVECLPFPYVTDEISMIRQTRVISPAFSQSYEYFDQLGDGVWFESNESEAVIRWKASLDGEENPSVTNFGLRLFPDGRFEFLYGDISHPIQKHTVYPGVSKGDDENYRIDPAWNMEELANKSFSFKENPLPSGIGIDETGLLTISNPDTSRIFDISVKVTDACHISDSRTFQLSDGLIILSGIHSGDDNRLIYGREANMDITVINQGSGSIRNLALLLRSGASQLRISDSSAFIPQLNSGQTLTVTNAFSFQLDEACPDMSLLPLIIFAESDQKTLERTLTIPVSAPEIVTTTPYICGGAEELLQPGEVADLVIPIRNTGSVSAYELDALLEPTDSSIQILSDTLITIGLISPMTDKELKFRIKASRFAIPGSSIPLILRLSNHAEITKEYSIDLTLGKVPVALVKLSLTTSSADSMHIILDNLNVSYQQFTSLPVPLSRFHSLFVLLGASSQGSHVISQNEGLLLSEYLNNGGRLYMEGYSNWYYSSNPAIQPMFKYTSERIPIYYYSDVAGVPGTLGDSMVFNYANSIHYSVFSFEPVDPAIATLTDLADPPHSLEIVYDGEDYKTIGTMLEFGSLNDSLSSSSKRTLMHRYLDFFGVNTSGLYPFFHADKTNICTETTVSFEDDSYDHVSSWKWEFPGGNPATSFEQNPLVTYASSGLYDVKLEVSDGKTNQVLIKKSYIRVNQCQGIEDQGSSIKFSVYPNPATNRVVIKSSNEITQFSLKIFDLSGRLLLQNKPMNYTPADHFTADVSSLRPGIYFLYLFSNNGSGRVKLLIR